MTTTLLRSATACTIALGLLASAPARANGRFPASNAVAFSPTEPNTALVRTTFGLLATKDAGKTWGWICERAIGFSGLEDPSYTITKNGTIVAGLFEGIRVSHDGGCTWEAVPTEGYTVFIDTTLRSDGAVLALASGYDKHGDAGILYKSQIFVSTDDGKTFAKLGKELDPTLLAESLEVAASDPKRVYVSAVRGDAAPRQGVLLVSTDGGTKWIERKIESEGKELAPFIGAVDPKRPDRVFLRTSASPEHPTRLLVTDDAGKTFRSMLAAKGPLVGFALSPDGKTVNAGGPDDGLWGGATSAPELAKVSDLKVQCLGRSHAGALWACSNEAQGFVAGVSTDDGAKFAPRLHLTDIAGPLECAHGTSVAKECTTEWAKLRSQLGFVPEAMTTDGGVPDAGRAAAAPNPKLEGPKPTGLTTTQWLIGAAGLAVLVFLLVSVKKKTKDG